LRTPYLHDFFESLIWGPLSNGRAPRRSRLSELPTPSQPVQAATPAPTETQPTASRECRTRGVAAPYATPWVRSPWVRSPWVRSPWVRSPWVRSPWVRSPWVRSPWVRTTWVRSPWLRAPWVRHLGFGHLGFGQPWVRSTLGSVNPGFGQPWVRSTLGETQRGRPSARRRRAQSKNSPCVTSDRTLGSFTLGSVTLGSVNPGFGHPGFGQPWVRSTLGSGVSRSWRGSHTLPSGPISTALRAFRDELRRGVMLRRTTRMGANSASPRWRARFRGIRDATREVVLAGARRGGVEREFAAESVLRASAVALADLGGATNERVEPAVRTSHDLRAAHGGGAATWHADRSVRSIDGTATSAGLKCTNLGGAGRHPRHESAQTDVAHGGDDRLREARGHVQAEVRAF